MSQVMNTPTQHIDLSQFSGSERLYRILPRLVITEGVQYLADQTQCYWLVSAIYSHLVTVDVCSEFVVATLTVSEQRAALSLDDGNGRLICHQHIEHTDFPLREITLYCCYHSSYWTLLLPTEY